MIPFSADAAQAIINVEQVALEWMFRSLPLGAIILIAAVGLAVSWLSWTEGRPHAAHARHFRA